jgi:hypothetical protein
MYEVYEVLSGSNGYTIKKIIEITKGSKEEVKFHLIVLIKLNMVTRSTPIMTGIVRGLKTYSDDEIIYKIN